MFAAECAPDLFSHIDYSLVALAAQTYEIVFLSIIFYNTAACTGMFNDLPRLDII